MAVAVLLVLALLMGLVTIPGQGKGESFERIPFWETSNRIAISSVVGQDENKTGSLLLDAGAYIKSDNWKHTVSLKGDLRLLDSLYPDHYRNTDLLCTALTKENTVWPGSNLDSLNLLLTWVVTLNCDDEGDSEYRMLFLSVYRYWMSALSNRLNELSNKDHSIKYGFRFRYLRERCRQLAYPVGVGDDNVAKIVNNIADQRWHYLLVDRLWKSTSWPFRCCLLLIVAGSAWGWFLVIIKLKTIIWKK